MVFGVEIKSLPKDNKAMGLSFHATGRLLPINTNSCLNRCLADTRP
jgi:hypothetical protein